MFPNAPLFPERASEVAAQVDHLFFFALGLSAFFSLLIAGLIFYLGVRYRRRSPDEVGRPPHPESRATTVLEVAWSVIPLGLLTILFVWGAKVYFVEARPPANATQFFVVGKQWMWKIQHPEGNREINELHVPVGRPIRLTMTSEDVIHSFFVPAFRIKADVLPGRYSTLWFQANRTGTYHLFCAQYCGAEHSKMSGRVVVMEPHDYQAWLSGAQGRASSASSGEELFTAKACATCHRPDTAARAPFLAGLPGRRVRLQDGRSLTADETYIRESILDPQARIVAGYQPIMPAFKGQLSEEDLIQLIGYIKTLRPPGGGPAAAAGSPGRVTPHRGGK
jgi:cytochrome c oxidase subunit II